MCTICVGIRYGISHRIKSPVNISKSTTSFIRVDIRWVGYSNICDEFSIYLMQNNNGD